jgi:hypothetical protein
MGRTGSQENNRNGLQRRRRHELSLLRIRQAAEVQANYRLTYIVFDIDCVTLFYQGKDGLNEYRRAFCDDEAITQAALIKGEALYLRIVACNRGDPNWVVLLRFSDEQAAFIIATIIDQGIFV